MSSKLITILTDTPHLFTTFRSVLSARGWTVTFASDLLAAIADNSQQKMISANKERALVILNSTCHIYTSSDIAALEGFNAHGGALFVAATENDHQLMQTNVNSLLNLWGIRFDSNCIIRPNPYDLYHPKEAVLVDFIVNRGMKDAFKRYVPTQANLNGDTQDAPARLRAHMDAPKIVYPNGCSLRPNKNLVVMMTSSSWAIPANQPICVFFQPKSDAQGPVVALGSVDLMNDNYLSREKNIALVSAIFDFIERDKNFTINLGDARTVETPNLTYLPDINHLLDIPVGCLQGTERIPKDPTTLIEKRLFNIDSRHLPDVIKAYRDLGVPHEPLTLIKPEFIRQYFDFEPATFGFRLTNITRLG